LSNDNPVSGNSLFDDGDFVSDIQSITTPIATTTSNISILNILIIVVVLAILGINVLGYAEHVLEYLINLINPLVKYFGYSIINVVDTTVDNTRVGSKFGIDIISDASKSVLNDIDGLLDIDSSKSDKGQTIKNIPYDDYEGDDSASQIQRGGKAGYCYIGSDRSVRSCVKVTEQQKCMSGKVFPRMDICINPSLRL